MPKKYTPALIQTQLSTLRATVPRLTTAVTGLTDTQLGTNPAPDAWSINTILAHVRSGTEIWSYSIYAMLTLEQPVLAYIHPRDWDRRMRYAGLTFSENIHAFEIARHNLLRILEGLNFEEWSRSATFAGKVNTFTVYGETLRMAMHEIDHCTQIESIVQTLM